MAAPKLEQTDYPSLTLGHPESSCTTLNIVGLEVYVYGLEEIKASNLPIAAVIATHGRCNNAKQMAHFAHGLLGHIGTLSPAEPQKRDAIVVTLDQRNHGKRTVDKTANLSYEQNPNHLIDMSACVVGGCQDVSFVMDFLAAYLFPNGERTIDEWVATGISLGGNLTWRLLQTEPRIKTAIPLIGLPFPSFPKYLRARAESQNRDWAPPLYPPSLHPVLETPPAKGIWGGKNILTIHGGSDTLVPFGQGREDIEGIQKEVGDGGGNMEVVVVPGVGHVVTADMLRRTGEWIWRFALQG